MPRWVKPISIAALICIAYAASWINPVRASPITQQGTFIAPTVTGTPSGPIVTVRNDQEQVNVRSGPNVFFPQVGYLLPGQAVVVKGITEAGMWLLIDYPGVQGGTAWVYSPLMNIPAGFNVPIVESPPTLTPATTSTIDPTLAAQFIVTSAPTRLPTFTPPPPLVIPTLPADSPRGSGEGIPAGIVIITLAALGVFLGFLSFLRGR